jgi:hypothetical protein
MCNSMYDFYHFGAMYGRNINVNIEAGNFV